MRPTRVPWQIFFAASGTTQYCSVSSPHSELTSPSLMMWISYVGRGRHLRSKRSQPGWMRQLLKGVPMPVMLAGILPKTELSRVNPDQFGSALKIDASSRPLRAIVQGNASLVHSAREEAPIDHDHRTGDEAGCVTRKKNCGANEFLNLAKPFHRRAHEVLLASGCSIQQVLI